MRLEINPETMTLRDIEDMEAATGRPIGEFLARFEGRQAGEVRLTDFPAKMLTAMVWVFGRKTEPTLTLEEARDTALVELDFSLPPEGAGGTERASNGSRNSRASTGSRRRNSGR